MTMGILTGILVKNKKKSEFSIKEMRDKTIKSLDM